MEDFGKAISSTLSEAVNPFVKKGERIMAKHQFFPRVNYKDPKSVAKRWYLKASYRDILWFRYLADIFFRKAVNSYILDKKRDKETLVNVMTDALVNKEGWIFEMNGFIRSGKSRFARRLIRMYANLSKRNYVVHCNINDINNAFVVDLGYDDTQQPPFHVYVTYSVAETGDVIRNHFVPGDVIYQDEDPDMHGAGSTIAKDNIENLIRIAAGKKNINIIFISPEFREYSNVDYYITILGVNKIRQRTCALISIASDKHIGVMEIKVTEDPALTKYYEDMSDIRKTELQESGGMSTVNVLAEEKAKLVDMLLVKAKEKQDSTGIPIKTKKNLEGIALEVPEVWSYQHKSFVIDEAFAKIKYGNVLDDELDFDDEVEINDLDPDDSVEENEQFDVSDFDPDVRKILKKYDNSRDAEIYIRNRLDGEAQDRIAIDYQELTQSAISLNNKKIYVWLNQRIGTIYEKFLEKRLWRRHPDAINIKRYGLPTEPDIVVELPDDNWIIYSIKCFDTPRKSTSIGIEDLIPEINHARNLKQQSESRDVKCVLHFLNRFNMRLTEIDLDFIKPEETYLIDTN